MRCQEIQAGHRYDDQLWDLRGNESFNILLLEIKSRTSIQQIRVCHKQVVCDTLVFDLSVSFVHIVNVARDIYRTSSIL